MAQEEIVCCVKNCELPLDANYWNNQYITNTTGWDLGVVSPPIQQYINAINNKNLAILIPGCGNSYEAEYLLDNGFTNITVIDIAPKLVDQLKEKFIDNKNIKIILGDFFQHQHQYDLIIEQTFFCALPPFMRQRYVYKMHQLLKANGILLGLLFNRHFEKQGPPFGGNQHEYEQLFIPSFIVNQLGTCTNSVVPRLGSELWFDFSKNENVTVQLFHIEGVTCSNCANTIIGHLKTLDHVLQVSINTNFTDLLVVSTHPILLSNLQDKVSYDSKYKIVNNQL